MSEPRQIPQPLYSCSNEYCRTECSYPSDMLFWYEPEKRWVCDNCWDNLPRDENEELPRRGESLASYGVYPKPLYPVGFTPSKNIPLDEAIQSIVSEFNISSEKLTRAQLAEAIKQAVQSGDFIRFVHADSQGIAYLPFEAAERMSRELNALRDKIKFVANECDCRIEHGVDSEHLRAMRDILNKILNP